MSMYHTQDLNYIWLLVGDGVTILVWEVADEYSRKGTTANKADEALFARKRATWDIASWCCNFVMMLLTVVTADFIYESHASAIYAILGLIICFAGSFFCDIDILSFGSKPQRNPLTHGYILPFVIWWYPYLVLSSGESFLIIFPAMFCLGAASHLLLDTMPENVGFIKRFEELFNIKYNPKEIRFIPKQWQHLWLLICAAILIMCFGFSIPRCYGTYDYTWSLPQTDYAATLATYPYIFILILGFIGIGGFFAVLILFWKFGTNLAKQPEERKAAISKKDDSGLSGEDDQLKEDEDKKSESTPENEIKESSNEENSS